MTTDTEVEAIVDAQRTWEFCRGVIEARSGHPFDAIRAYDPLTGADYRSGYLGVKHAS